MSPTSILSKFVFVLVILTDDLFLIDMQFINFKDQDIVWVRTTEGSWSYGQVAGHKIRVGPTRHVSDLSISWI